MNKTAKRVIIILIALVLVFLLLNRKLDFFGNKKSPLELTASTEEKRTPVSAMILNKEAIENKIKVTGTILPNESVEIRPEISGRVTKINFREGQKVRKGELLITFNDEELVAQLEKLKYTKKLYEDVEFRQKKLLEREAISLEEYERSLTELNTSGADIKLIQAQIDRYRIIAPFDGIVGLRMVSEGGYVTPSNVLTSIFNVNPIKIEFSVPGRYASQITNGKKIYFKTESSPEVVEGVIYAIEPQIDLSTRTLKIRAKAPNSKENILPGQFANIEVVLENVNNAVMVPTSAVIPEMTGHKIFIMEKGRVSSRAVEIGIRTDAQLQLVSGIVPGDTLITSGIMQIKDGDLVSIQNIN